MLTTTFLTANFPWIFTASALIGTTWRYIRMVFSWVRGLAITRVHINDHQTVYKVQGYLNSTMKPAKFNDVNFRISSKFVWTRKRSLHVAYKNFGSGTLFFDKRGFPLLVTGAKGDKERNEGTATMVVTFIRGTFDFEELIKAVANKTNEDLQASGSDDFQRFRVRRHFGYGKNGRNDHKSPSEVISGRDQSMAQDEELSYTPLNFTKEELAPLKRTKPFSGLSYTEEIKKKIEYIKHWKNSSDWFNNRNIPWTRSIRLRGKPGTGKTSFARAIAYELNMPIHIIDLTTMTNEELTNAWAEVVGDAPSIALFEDIDRLFNEKKEFILKDLTLDCLLNCISGVSEANGVLTVTTVNFPERLDIALGVIQDGKSTRPGRLDFEIVFEELTEKCRREIASRILDEYPEVRERIIREGDGDTGAQFTQRCCEAATDLYWASFGVGSVKTESLSELSH